MLLGHKVFIVLHCQRFPWASESWVRRLCGEVVSPPLSFRSLCTVWGLMAGLPGFASHAWEQSSPRRWLPIVVQLLDASGTQPSLCKAVVKSKIKENFWWTMLTMNYKCVFRIATSIPSFWQELYDSVLMRPKVIISQVPSTAALGSSFHLICIIIYFQLVFLLLFSGGMLLLCVCM